MSPRATREHRWGVGAATGLLAAAGIAAWWPVLGRELLWAAPALALAVLLAARAVPARAGAALLVVWIPAALLLAGLPVDVLRPGALGGTGTALLDGLDALTVPARGPIVTDPYPLAGALAAGGLLWGVAAMLAARSGRAWAAAAFVLLLLPLAGALALEQTGDAAWHGAIVLAAGLLWLARGRVGLVLPATLAVTLVAIFVTQAVGPHDRWVAFGAGTPRKPAFSTLDTTQTYGPLRDRRTGATMLEIDAAAPALWRMRVLERFNGRAWTVSGGPPDHLPEPAAVTETATVRVHGLRNDLVVSPGRIVTVDSRGRSLPAPGDARLLTPAPGPGDTYRVTAEVVHATSDELRRVQVPDDEDRYDRYTRLWRYELPGAPPGPAVEMADSLSPAAAMSPWGQVLRLARRLSIGATSQLEIVQRVESYLLDGGRFRYTTDVPAPGADPLLEFLLDSRAGYCQQFAGAAALLLRLAGVPTRVVSGFATGTSANGTTYDVRDTDAHAWIEVYFPGFGWIPFNPTPAGAAATVDPAIDVLAPRVVAVPGSDGDAVPILAGAAALLLLGGVAGARRRRRAPAPQLGGLLARLTDREDDPVTPAMTLAALRPRLARIGPAVAALAETAERTRFAAPPEPAEPHPRLRVWRALVADLGPARAAALLLRRPRHLHGAVQVGGARTSGG